MSTDESELATYYSPATNTHIQHVLHSHIDRNEMSDPMGAIERIDKANIGINQPEKKMQYKASEFADTVVSKMMLSVQDVDVKSLMTDILIHPPFASSMNVYSSMLKKMEDKLKESSSSSLLASNQVRMVESMFNYNISGLLKGVGRDPSTGLVEYDMYGRPKFEASIFSRR